MKEKIKIGVIGVGHMGQLHISKICKLGHMFNIEGIYDKNEDLAVSVAQKYNLKNYDSMESLLERIDAVIIAANTSAHFEILKKSLSSKVDILVEKPMVANLEQAQEVYHLLKNSCSMLQVGYIERFNPIIRFLQEYLKNKVIKKLIFVRESHNSRCRDVDVISDLMIHDIDLAYSLVNEEFELIESEGFSVTKTDLVEFANASIVTSSGKKIFLSCSRISKENKRQIKIITGNEYIEADLINQSIYIYNKSNDVLKYEISGIEMLYEDALMGELLAFESNIQNRVVEFCNYNDGVKSLQVVKKIESVLEKF